ncbi:putative spermidine/putrescine transport system permease protein [Rhizobiales bacterium GAS188]|nr:putative spermidine/putrescine transport system permease protein [Rhizobiales bacterium GAS188]
MQSATSVKASAPPRMARSALLPIAPATLVLACVFLAPLLGLMVESFREFTPGRVGSVAGAPFTFANYLELVSPSFAGVLIETFEISIAASLVGLIIAFPLAYCAVRRFSPRWRAATIGLMITLVLLSMLVRTYALELTFGSVGVLRPLLLSLGISPTSRWYIEGLVGAGLLHAVVPICTLTLLGAVQNVDPRLADAAKSLGAPAWKAHLDTTIPLSLPALISAFLVALTFSISAFVIPMVLGKGRVLFVSNVIYNRFGDIANYPSGAAVSVVMLGVSLIVVYGVSRAQRPRRRSP